MWLVLGAALGDGDGVGESCVVFPQGEFAEGGLACEEVEDGSGYYALGIAELDAGSGGEGCGCDFVGVKG